MSYYLRCFKPDAKNFQFYYINKNQMQIIVVWESYFSQKHILFHVKLSLQIFVNNF